MTEDISIDELEEIKSAINDKRFIRFTCSDCNFCLLLTVTCAEQFTKALPKSGDNKKNCAGRVPLTINIGALGRDY